MKIVDSFMDVACASHCNSTDAWEIQKHKHSETILHQNLANYFACIGNPMQDGTCSTCSATATQPSTSHLLHPNSLIQPAHMLHTSNATFQKNDITIKAMEQLHGFFPCQYANFNIKVILYPQSTQISTYEQHCYLPPIMFWHCCPLFKMCKIYSH